MSDHDLELAWTTWADSCRDELITLTGDLRQCRRTRGHELREGVRPREHASGFGMEQVTWGE